MFINVNKKHYFKREICPKLDFSLEYHNIIRVHVLCSHGPVRKHLATIQNSLATTKHTLATT